MNSIDVGSYVQRALGEPALYEAAFKQAAEIIGSWKFQPKTRDYIRVSDAGHCVRERWAHIHGFEDIPEDFKGELKMLNGSLMGAAQMCLFRQAYLAENPTHEVHLEFVTQDGEPGHLDALITIDGVPDRVIEEKSNFSFAPVEPPKMYHKLQSGKYGKQTKAPKMSIHQLRLTAKDGARWERTDTYETAEYQEQVQAEYQRLGQALLEDMPDPDPNEPWRCKYCRFGACERNVNPLKGIV